MNQKPILQSIDPRLIKTDLKTQVRKKTCEDTIREYAEAMESGTRFPPLTVFFDFENSLYILADGFHRLFAHLQVRPNDPIIVDQYLGNVKDALRFAVGANKSHGLKRSNDDKRNAVEIYFIELEGGEQSDRQVADFVGVSHQMASLTRKRLVAEGRLSNFDSRVGSDGRSYNIANIGKKPDGPYFCTDCGHYKSPRCLIEGEMREPTHPACEEFILIIPPEPEAEIEEIYDPRSELEHVPAEIRHRVSRRPSGDYIAVPLSRTNTDLAAVEIRHFFDDNYLAALVQSALKLLKD